MNPSASTTSVLFELGLEELPPHAVRPLAEALLAGVLRRLQGLGLGADATRLIAAPRRLGFLLDGVPLTSAPQRIERRGPAVSAAFDAAGQPTRAVQGFAASCGVMPEQLVRRETDKGTWLFFEGEQPGQPLAVLLPGLIAEALAELPLTKRMRWGAERHEFIRPAHWVVLLVDDTVVPTEVLGVTSDRVSRGHRAHHPGAVVLSRAGDYPTALAAARVQPDLMARKELIRAGVEAEAARLGGTPVWDEALLEELTALTEWPVVLSGSFESRYLEIPAEVIIAVLQGHQRYVPLRDAASGGLISRFVFVANLESADPAAVVAGNERVIRPRLADAEFFWRSDRAHSLLTHRPALDRVVFQQKLGTLGDKTQRVERLALWLALQLGQDDAPVRLAAPLSRCDLQTGLVGEFPELQGVIGRELARAEGVPEAVAQALDDLYAPRGAGAALPRSETGALLALADRLDTLIGGFAAGLKPTGAKDAFALRRAALGLIRIAIEQGRGFDLQEALKVAASGYPEALAASEQASEVFDFVIERLNAWYAEQGLGAALVTAVAAVRPTVLVDFDRRAKAVAAFAELPEAAALAAANKRIGNLLRKAEGVIPEHWAQEHLSEPAEQALALAVQQARLETEPLFADGDYVGALKRLAALRGPVDAFFDQVLVMAEDLTVRQNRLAVLRQLNALFLRTADVGVLGA